MSYFCSNCWVIDDQIRSFGVPISASLTPDLHGKWASSAARKAPTRGEDAPEPCFVSMAPPQVNSPCLTVGSYEGGTSFQAPLKHLNGPYMMQKEKINGRPHLIKKTLSADQLSGPRRPSWGPRCHLFWSSTSRAWVFAAQCDESEGVLALCVDAQQPSFDQAKYAGRVDPIVSAFVPLLAWAQEDIPEPNLMLKTYSVAQAEVEFGLRENSVATKASDLFDASQYLADLLPWEMSNHDAIFVARSGPERGGVRLLCRKPSVLAAGLHPDLRSLLEVHSVELGLGPGAAPNAALTKAAVAAALESTEKMVNLFGELTERPRGPKEAASLIGGKFVLTSDTMSKVPSAARHRERPWPL